MIRHLAVRSPGIVVILMILGLLLAFQHVVRGGVQRGDQWRKDVAMHADATWRCHQQRGADLRQLCLAGLGRAP